MNASINVAANPADYCMQQIGSIVNSQAKILVDNSRELSSEQTGTRINSGLINECLFCIEWAYCSGVYSRIDELEVVEILIMLVCLYPLH